MIHAAKYIINIESPNLLKCSKAERTAFNCDECDGRGIIIFIIIIIYYYLIFFLGTLNPEG